MPVTCAKHCFKGFLLCFRAVSSRPVTCQLHAGYMSYVIVNPHEADLHSGKISIKSPIAKALLGKKAGDEVMVKVPAGLLKFRLDSVEL